jgi:hypothetical protein
MTVRPFEVAWKNEDVADVRRKVKEVHLPPAPPGSGWTYGCELPFSKSCAATGSPSMTGERP